MICPSSGKDTKKSGSPHGYVRKVAFESYLYRMKRKRCVYPPRLSFVNIGMSIHPCFKCSFMYFSFYLSSCKCKQAKMELQIYFKTKKGIQGILRSIT